MCGTTECGWQTCSDSVDRVYGKEYWPIYEGTLGLVDKCAVEFEWYSTTVPRYKSRGDSIEEGKSPSHFSPFITEIAELLVEF
jgi:hypothetical protein